jgi:hypothetical protein
MLYMFHSYREAALLIDVHQSSAGRKQGVARTVSHELAHQCTRNTTETQLGRWLYSLLLICALTRRVR